MFSCIDGLNRVEEPCCYLLPVSQPSSQGSWLILFVPLLLISCFAYSLLYSISGFRLNAPIVEGRNVSWRSACVDVCFAHPCCRSMNYKHATSANQSDECELLHDRVDNTSYALETNSSFDHFFFNEPLKLIKLIKTIQF